jgi:hypothetical protein
MFFPIPTATFTACYICENGSIQITAWSIGTGEEHHHLARRSPMGMTGWV